MLIKARLGYRARQPAFFQSDMSERATPQPPDTKPDETWDRVTDAQPQFMAGHWVDDIPYLLSVANSFDADE